MIAAFTGLIAGFVHVLTGPDHLVAIAPLAVRRPRRAWLPGVRWGFGHSTGVALVGLLSLWLRDLISVNLISSWGERFVGVMLFGIGLWALQKALKHTIHTHEHEHDGGRHVHIHIHHHGKRHHESGSHLHTHAAFGIGTLHGLAGSSHFLGILPMLALPTRTQAISYLIAFGVGTIAAMASFSWGMGFVATKCSVRGLKIYRVLMTACAVTAMAVGGFWLATSFH